MNYLSQCDTTTGCGTIYPADLSHCPECKASQAFSTPALLNPRDWGYDIETYPNIFSVVFIHAATGVEYCFEISTRKNQGAELIQFIFNLGQSKARGIGFNNLSFDYPVIHYIAHNPGCTVDDIYAKSQQQIVPFGQWAPTVWDKDQVFEQLDLLKICHFDNKARMTSLKALEINMQSQNVIDLPYPPGTYLTHDEMDVLIGYNHHDVRETLKFYVRCLDSIKFREELTQRYNRNFMNHNDTKIGKDYFIMELENAGVACYTQGENERKRPIQTIRDSISFTDVIFPYIKFERPEFNEILEKFRTKTIKKSELDDMEKEKGKKESLVTKGVFKDLNTTINGFTYVFGVGGIHASIESQIVTSDEKHQIVDIDVASFYPNLAIANRLYPKHLTDKFCDIYLNVYQQRKSYPKGSAPNGMLKLALNGVYGDSNSAYSPFYDPMYTMTITVNGQLLLAMLAEQLMKIPGLKMVQCNTDGVTVSCPRVYLDQMRAVCKWWEGLTQLQLEEALYTRMMIRDVNNYIAEYEGGKLKRKGAYEYQYQWHQDPSAMIAPMAAEAALVRGEDVRQFITSHQNPFDFMLRAKIPKGSQLVMRWPEWEAEQPLQHTTRYFVSRNGGSMVKVSPPTEKAGTWKRRAKVPDATYYAVLREILSSHYSDTHPRDVDGTPWDARIHTGNKSQHNTRELSICAGWRVTECADAKDFKWSEVNYDWYIAEAEKLVTPLLGK